MGKKIVLALFLIIFVIGVFSIMAIRDNANISYANQYGIAPDFTLKDINGNAMSLGDFKGKVVILDFWATWCPPCREEIPHFKELYTQYKEKGLEIIGVALDDGGLQDVKPFAEENGINYPILLGNDKVTRDYGGIKGIPTTFVIDRQGNIIEKFLGYRQKEVFEKIIKKLL